MKQVSVKSQLCLVTGTVVADLTSKYTSIGFATLLQQVVIYKIAIH